MTELARSPKVFISYAWEDDTRIWVRELATRLRFNGVETILDQWDVAPGDSLPEFMESSVSVSDFVLIICTPAYKRKSDSSDPSGVGYEKGVITGELFVKRNQRKFIPVLRKGKWLEAAPSWVLGKNHIDLRGKSYNEDSYQELLRTIYGKRNPPPPLGTPPDFSGIDDGREAAEKTARETAKLEAAEKTKREKAERRAAQIASLKETFSKSIASLKSNLPKAFPILKAAGFAGIVIALVWIGSLKLPNLVSLVPTLRASVTLRPSASPAPPSKTLKPNATSTKTSTPTLTPAPLVFNPHPDSSDYFDEFGVSMRLVPEGKFKMGSTTFESDEQPVHQLSLNAFYIDKYEVTNILYDVCVQDGKCRKPQNLGSRTRASYYDNPKYIYYPVMYIDWIMAKNYCEWRGARLPTEAEWEKAARGTDGRTYPWGNDIDCSYANYLDCTGDTTQVGNYEKGKSVYGAYDLAYNVWEWTSSLYMPYPYSAADGREDLSSSEPRVLRGSSFNGGAMINIFTDRFGWWQDRVSSQIGYDFGFRCALTP